MNLSKSGKRLLRAVSGLVFIAVVLMQTGCGFLPGISKFGSYPNADKYNIGSFDYDSSKIHSVVINWVSGDIAVTQGNSKTLHVEEEGKKLKDAQKLHWLVEGSTLTIQYCESRYKGRLTGTGKPLQIEIPQNVDLIISSVSADVNLKGTQDLKSLEIDSVSGSVLTEDLAVSKKGSINTVSGNVSLNLREFSSFNIDTVSGDTELSEAPYDTSIIYETVSGTLHADGFSKEAGRMVRGNGSSTIQVDSVSGSLTA